MSDIPPPVRDRRDDGRPEQARPRDRTGRPLPYGTAGVPTTEAVDPTDVDEALAIGVARWDQQRYFEAHEALEYLWKRATGDDRALWKGIIQIAVAGVHLQRGNPAGAHRLLVRGLARLEPLPDLHRGIDVARMRRTARPALDVLGDGGVPAADWGPFPLRGPTPVAP